MFRAKITPKKFFPNNLIAWKSTLRGAEKSLDLDNRDMPDNSVVGDTEFAASKRGSFFQEAPRLGNQFSGDLFLQSYLKRVLPYEVKDNQHEHNNDWSAKLCSFNLQPFNP